MNQKNLCVPLSYMRDYDDGQIAWNVNLPDYIEDERISLNIGKLRSIAKWSGLSRLEISSEHSENYLESLQKYNEFYDNPYQVELYEDTYEEKNTTANEYIWGLGKVAINATELSAKILRKSDEGQSLDDPTIWGDALDIALKNSIDDLAKFQLLECASGFGKANAFSILALSLGAGFVMKSPAIIAPLAISASIASQSISMYYQDLKGNSFSKRRLSLIPGYQIDRLLVVKGILNYKRLVGVNNVKSVSSELK